MYGYNTGTNGVNTGYSYGAIVPAQTSGLTLEEVKAWGDKESIKGVKNKYLVGGAVLLGLGYYGYTKGWFR